MTEMEDYLKPTYAIDCNHQKIVEKAKMLVDGCSGDAEKTVALFSFVRDSIHYNLHMISVFIEDFRASKILEWEKGYCVQKAVLLAALGRAVGIPSRLAFAKIMNHKTPEHIVQKRGNNIFPRHGYNQFYINDHWISAAATFDRKICENHNLPLVVFDGKVDAILPETDNEGNLYIEYLEKYQPASDFPFDWIAKRISKLVGPDKRATIKAP